MKAYKLKSKVKVRSTVKNKRIKAIPVSRLKAKAWELCKQITRLRYVNKNGTWNCYTCDRLIDEPAKAQTGHMLASSTCGAYLRHDLRNLRIQCYNCNINQGGNGAEYHRRMIEEIGQDAVNQLFTDKQKIVKADAIFYQDLITKYTKILKELQSEDTAPIK